MGILPTKGKATMETIPSSPDKSMFSCERYQFMLDAPFEISPQCCKIMKKNPAHKYAKETGRMGITAQMASESRLRTQQWIRNGCNGFELKNPISNPMAFWFSNDVMAYLKMHDIAPCKVYGEIVSDKDITGQLDFNDIADSGIFDFGMPCFKTTAADRTGCFACGFGITKDDSKEKSRLQNIIDYSNPKLADWCLRGGHFRDTDGMWEPHKGLGLAFCYEWINRHGGFNIWFPDREKYLDALPEEAKAMLAR